MKLDVSQQLAKYTGVIGWNAGALWPAIEIPLFIKDHPIPTRKPKVTEVGTASHTDPVSGKGLGVHYIFFGAPDILQMNLSGWIITPRNAQGHFDPKDASGSSLNYGNISYPELIYAFIEGRINVTSGGAPQRKDPDYYTSPHGHHYLTPTIASFDAQYGPVMKKQAFTMTLMLEK